MSRGPGRVQRAIKELFDARPGKWFTNREIAAHVFGPQLKDWHITNIARTMPALAPLLGLSCTRVGSSGVAGWKYVWKRKAI